jgi:hypothetical protein
MKDRLKLVRQIFALAMEINEQGKYYVFFDLQPHVNLVCGNVAPVSNYQKNLYKFRTYYNVSFYSDEHMTLELRKIITNLSRYLEVQNG